MSSLSPVRYDCRSDNSIYMFEFSNEELSLKIISISKEVLFNQKFSSGDLPFLEFKNSFSMGSRGFVFLDLETSNIIPKKHRPLREPKEVIALSEILKESGTVKDVVHAYYKESVQALLDKDTHRLSLCTREIRQIDPQMEHLSTDQKMHLLTQEHIVSLSKELQYMKRLKAFDLIDIIKNPKRGTSQRERENAIDFLRNMTVSEDKLPISDALFVALENSGGSMVRLAAAEFLEKLLLERSICDEERLRLRLILEGERDERILSKLLRFVKIEKTFLSDAFGKKDWEKHFEALGEIPPLPNDIEKTLNSPCPFHEGPLVGETHILVLIPQKINGKFLTLNSFADLVQGFPEDKSLASGNHKDGNNRLKKSYWMLMTKDHIPGSINTHGEKKTALIKKYPSYTLPLPIEAAVGITLHYLRHGYRICSTHTLCQQRGNLSNLKIKGSSGGGYYCDSENISAGITGVLRFL